MRIQTIVSRDDYEILLDVCRKHRISISALVKALITDFLDCTDKERVADIIAKAQKVKSGRPKSDY
jgi:hypothetical protein